MPLYEYTCTSCHHRFERLSFGDAPLVCPRCGGREAVRQLSTFAVGSAGSPAPRSAAPGPCGSCGDPRGPGACQMD